MTDFFLGHSSGGQLFFHQKHHFYATISPEKDVEASGRRLELKKRCLGPQATSARLLGFLEKIMYWRWQPVGPQQLQC